MELSTWTFRRAVDAARHQRGWLLALAWAWSTASVGAQVALSGKFEVSAGGAATYSIPVKVPPGVAGMEPRLSLDYSSHAGNGMLGVGWKLSGLPVVARCPRTSPQDGVKGAVMYDQNDRFCLDGRRLMLVSGVYGAAGSEYRTELETFAKVVAVGSAPGGGPQSFVVKTKDGLTMEFGNTADSSLAVAGKLPAVVRTWALSRVRDTLGNAQTIAYWQQPGGGALYPSRIEYTSNANVGLVAINELVFVYQERGDKVTGYQGGYPFASNQRLVSIKVHAGPATGGGCVEPGCQPGAAPWKAAWSYDFDYDDVVPVQMVRMQSRIKRIRYCSESRCAPATSMGFMSSPAGASAFNVQASMQTEASQGSGTWFAMDVDGDGRTDLLHLKGTSGQYAVWKLLSTGSFAIDERITSIDTNLQAGRWLQVDVNGDGLADQVHLKDSAGNFSVWRSNGDGTFTITNHQAPSGTDVNLNDGFWKVADVNGDGLGDLIHFTSNPGQLIIWRSNGDGTFTITEFTSGSDWNLGNGSWQIFDVNGDGLADLVHITSNPGGIIVWRSAGNGSFEVTSFTTPSDIHLTYGPWVQIDVNGDGLTDMVHFRITENPNRAAVWLSKGDGTFEVSVLPAGVDRNFNSAGAYQILDVNGDGLADIVHTHATLGDGFHVWTSKGDGTFDVALHEFLGGVPDNCTSNCTTMLAGDFQGNGMPGFVRVDQSRVRSIWLLGAKPSGLATSIDNGAGQRWSWTLETLPSLLGTQYLKDLPSDGEVLTIVPALWVVQSSRRNSGYSHNQPMQDLHAVGAAYSYGSARVERNGRGFLGFNWFESRDGGTGLTTRTYFHQVFPYIGQPKLTGVGKGVGPNGWKDLKFTQIVAGCLPVVSGEPCPIAPGNTYFPYTYKTETRSWDLNGSPLPTSIVRNDELDSFGNIRLTRYWTVNPDGTPTEYFKRVDNTYFNDPVNWIIGRLTKSTVESQGPDVGSPVVPGSGALPSAPAPTLPPQMAAHIMSIIQMLLLDD